jgi:hypothetical protein
MPTGTWRVHVVRSLISLALPGEIDMALVVPLTGLRIPLVSTWVRPVRRRGPWFTATPGFGFVCAS